MDPRAHSEEKLVAPGHLPYVSRRSLKRIKDPLPPITKCPCGGDVVIKHHKYLYGRVYSDWPWVYYCEMCRSYVALHPHTDLPVGTLADQETRRARKYNRGYFHELMEFLGISQNEAREWMAKQMGIPESEAHWAMFDAETAGRAGEICRTLVEQMKQMGRK